ncbi:hypothetical protein [Streptomyces sp. NA02950]|nr:hypothetical protein [Streptomyces sp. NA02950]
MSTPPASPPAAIPDLATLSSEITRLAETGLVGAALLSRRG